MPSTPYSEAVELCEIPTERPEPSQIDRTGRSSSSTYPHEAPNIPIIGRQTSMSISDISACFTATNFDPSTLSTPSLTSSGAVGSVSDALFDLEAQQLRETRMYQLNLVSTAATVVATLTTIIGVPVAFIALKQSRPSL